MSLAALALVLALQEPATTAFQVPATALAGRTPTEVAALLGAAEGAGPADAVRIVDGGRTVDVYPAARFWRTAPAGSACVTGFPEVPGVETPSAPPRAELARRSRGWFVFEDGRLSGIHPEPLGPSGTGPATPETMRQAALGPKPASPMAAGFGRLPLSDGLTVLARLPAPPTELSVLSLCAPIVARGPRSGDVGTDIIWGLVGLTLLPTVPFREAEEARAEREGGALLGSVEPGAILAGGAEAFVGRLRGVRVYRDPADPDFAIVAIKLGNGTDNIADVGLLGVRGDRVVWKAQRRGADLLGLPALVCRDAENRPGDVRPGCSSYGFLRP